MNVKVILDAGCGTGENLQFLRSENYEVCGFDLSDVAIQFCKQRGITDVVKANISKLPYKNSSFDCICCMDVLACLSPKEYILALNEFARCTRPNGYLIINIAALPFLFSNHDASWHVKKRFMLNELIEDLESHNYKIIKGSYRVFLLFPLVVIYKIINKIYYLLSSKKVEDDLNKANPIINKILTKVMYFENYLFNFVNLPIGTSIFIVAQKTEKN